VVGGTVVVCGPEALYALALETGDVAWSVPRDGPPAAPAIARVDDTDLVIYPDGRGDDATVRAVDRATGEPAWEGAPTLESEVRTAVTIAEGRAFVVDEDGKLYAIDPSDGTLAWSRALPGSVLGTVAASGGRVFALTGAADAGGSARLVALEADTGEPAWAPVAPDAAASFGSVPAVVGGDVVFALEDGVVFGVSARDGSESWSVRISALVLPFSSPAATEDAVYLADRTGGLHRVTPGAGRDWLFAFNEQVLRQSPVAVGAVVLLGLDDGSVGAVDAESGNLVFRTASAGAPVTGMAVAGDLVVVLRSGSGRPRVVALRNDPDGALVDEPSPTVPDPRELALSFGVALAAVGGLALAAGRLAARRFSIVDPSRGDDDGSTEGPT
jgi:outer membrane protein assembly factor BamB